MKSFYSHGKLLITGEYLVLDGAQSLAVPTVFGQKLHVEENESNILEWISYDDNGLIWYQDSFRFNGDTFLGFDQKDNPFSIRLFDILNAVKTLNPDFLSLVSGCKVSTQLEFPREWGLGTSSTLINNIAQWASVNAYELLDLSFGGSGYDIACAQAKTPITYRLKVNNTPKHKRHINSVVFNPSFKEHLYFVYLNKKQNSRDGIRQYRANTSDLSHEILEVSEITDAMISCDDLKTFQELIERHEAIIAKVIAQNTIKDLLFGDFEGSIKSLGAWGGDFILVASEFDPKSYFFNRGYKTILTFNQMLMA